ncbi:hypothetical protein [Lacticaseibacillus hulanensis]|uniref:hypothetical protein n=1 Tax=Lacticaseibacillus hulanensis TaxID=2493111 RepID=UPI000FD6F255|nr:hypothetical protein [Lacticaseibacillus hulanensis]
MNDLEWMQHLRNSAQQFSQDDYDAVIRELAGGDYEKFVRALVHLENGELSHEDYSSWLGSDLGLLDETLLRN